MQDQVPIPGDRQAQTTLLPTVEISLESKSQTAPDRVPNPGCIVPRLGGQQVAAGLEKHFEYFRLVALEQGDLFAIGEIIDRDRATDDNRQEPTITAQCQGSAHMDR